MLNFRMLAGAALLAMTAACASGPAASGGNEAVAAKEGLTPTTPELPPGASTIVKLWEGDMPGLIPASERAKQREFSIETTNGQKAPDLVVINVTQPTLEIVRPTGKSNGAALVIAPGGGFRVLSYANEGTRVAKWAADHGFTAFIVKYRLHAMPNDPAEMGRLTGGGGPPVAGGAAPAGAPAMPRPMPAGPYERDGMADGLQALKYVREHASEYGIDPTRVGIVGFSAGGAVASSTATVADPNARPNFLGVIYSRVVGEVPQNPPPAFFAATADDSLARGAPEDFARWRAAGGEAEIHIYAEGGHGFGTAIQGLAVDGWLDAFYTWMVQQGVTTAK